MVPCRTEDNTKKGTMVGVQRTDGQPDVAAAAQYGLALRFTYRSIFIKRSSDANRYRHFSLDSIFKGEKIMLHAEDRTSKDPVRHSTAPEVNREIDSRTNSNIRRYANSSEEVIHRRIDELDQEWDIERALEVNASTLALTGLLLGVTVNRKWLLLPGVVLSFLLQHGLQGWCPPLPVLRRMGVRTRGEIDREKYELKALLEAR
jgi:hypothetical protein